MTEEDATTQVITSTSVPRGYFSVAFSSLMSIQLPLYDSEGNLGALSFLNKSLSPTQSIVAFNPEDFAEVEALLLDEPSVGISIILSSLELTKYDDPRKKAKDLLKLAELYERQDDLNSSVQALVDAREEVIKADIKTSAISLRIAEVLFHAGNFDRSASESRKYLEVATEYRLEAHVLAARALFELGEFGETIVHARSALDLLSSDPSPATNKLHWIYDLLILSYFSIGCNDLGFHYCARLEEILDSFPEEERAHSLLRIGQGLHIGRAYSDSIEVLSKALKLAQNSQMDELQVDILLFLSKSNSLLQNDKNAWSYCTEALRIARQQKNESALAQIYADMFGILKAIDSGNSHIPILRKALRFAKERPLLEVQITDLLGDEYSSINLSLAEDFYRKSIELSELVRGQLRGADPANLGFLNRFAHTYSSLEKVLVKQKRVDEALVIAEKRRGLALKDAFYKDSSNGNSRPVETVTDLLDIVENCKDAAFLLYSNHGDELFSWLIKSDRSIVFSTVDLTNHGTPYTPPLLDLADLAYQYLTEFACELPVCPVRSQTSPTVPCTMNYLHELYEYIVKPFEPHLAKVAWLVIVPDTNLPAIPYGLLVSKEHEFLIDRLAISTAPSILFFQMMTERHVESASENNQAPALIIGNPTMPKAWDDESQDWFRLESLDYSEKEARNIAQLLEVAPIIGPQATKECFLAASASAPIIHLATHSIWFDPNHPFSKGNIALAPTDLDDGILCTSDIGRQKMRARLVVLNLCRSADGHASADGVNGIARAFLASGACSVLSTIPDLDDDFSEDMIFMFYSYWLFQDKKLPEALREVMIEGRNKDSDPRKWGGYLLTCGNF